MGRRVMVALMLWGGCCHVWAGTMLREIWLQNLSLDEAEALMASGAEPDAVDILEESAWTNYADGYCARLSGWLTVPRDGAYQFHFVSDDNGRLYVSQDEEMAHAELVAHVDEWAGTFEWNKFPDTQHSEVMYLKKGQQLALYATMQEGTGGDNLAIGWTGPGLSDDPRDPNLISDWVTHIGPDLTVARKPSPAPGETDVPLDAVLSWKPGKYAASHHIYFGTSAEDVNTATIADPRGVLLQSGWEANEVAVGPLTLGQTYAWRVDEVNAPPDGTVRRGPLWQFTAEPVALVLSNITATASSAFGDAQPERTVDGSGLDEAGGHSTDQDAMWLSLGLPGGDWIQYEFDDVYEITEMRVWNANQEFEQSVGLGAKDVTVEVSVDGGSWTALDGVPTFAQAPGANGYQANTVVDFGGVRIRFVRLTLLSNWGGKIPQKGLSEVQFLYVPVKPRRPQPADGATLSRLDGELVWRAGRYAQQHDVYVGADRDRVDALDPAVRVATTPDRRLDRAAAGLLYDQQTYWRVVELNGQADPPTAAGPVWTFHTPPFGVVDDMESYVDEEPDRIFDHWIDGWNDPSNGSVVGYAQSPFAEQVIVHGGRQSMPFSYDNSGGVTSTATLSLGGQDWTRGGPTALVLYFLGERDNSGGQLFVEIGSQRVSYPGSLSLGLWKQWTIDLAGLSGLAHVPSLTIGVSGAGRGMLYLDDIRLMRNPAAVPQPVDPGSNGLVAHWRLDDASGLTAADAAGGHHGTLNGTASWVEGLDGGALSFDGLSAYVDCGADAAFDIDDAVTVSLWVQTADVGNGEHNPYLAKGNTAYALKQNNANRLEFFVYQDGTWHAAVEPVTSAFNGRWHHLAGTYDGQTVRLYVDGRLADSTEHTGGIGTNSIPLNLGRNGEITARLYEGLLDEVRLYRRALSLEEIRYLAGDR